MKKRTRKFEDKNQRYNIYITDNYITFRGVLLLIMSDIVRRICSYKSRCFRSRDRKIIRSESLRSGA